MGRRKSYKRRKKSLGSRLIRRLARIIFSVLILTAFVLSIAYFVKQAANLDTQKVVSVSIPYLSEMGFSVDKKKIGEVAGEFIKRATDVGIQQEGGSTSSSSAEENNSPSEFGDLLDSASTAKDDNEDNKKVLFKIAIFADSHIAKDKTLTDNKDLLKKALVVAEELEVNRAVHVGDITNLGVLGDLQTAKSILEDSDLIYYAIPGDRDLFVNPADPFVNFLDVFNKDNQTFKVEDYKFVMFNNSANYTKITEDKMAWFENNIKDADLVILSQPLFTNGLGPPRDKIYMGSTQNKPDEALVERQNLVKEQRDRLLEAVRNSSVKAVIAGDHHYPSRLKDSARSNLYHYVLGAVSNASGEYEDVAEILNVKPEFSTLSVYENGEYQIKSVVLD